MEGARLDAIAKVVIVVAASLLWLVMLAIVEGLLFWPFDPMSAGQKAGAFGLIAFWVIVPAGLLLLRRRHRTT